MVQPLHFDSLLITGPNRSEADSLSIHLLDLTHIQIQLYIHFGNSGSRQMDLDIEEKQKEHHLGIIPNYMMRYHHDKDLDKYHTKNQRTCLD